MPDGSNHTPNPPADTLEFCRLLTGQDDPVLDWRVFVDDKANPGASEYSGGLKMAGPLSRCWPALAQAQAAGCGIYAVINEGGASDKDIRAIRAVFVDADDVELPKTWHVEPHIICRRRGNPRKWHAYWLVDGLDGEQFRRMQRQLAEHYGTDPSISNPSRVMRLPGTAHQKRSASANPDQPLSVSGYTLEDCTAGLGRNMASSPGDVAAGLPEVNVGSEPSRAGPQGTAKTTVAEPPDGWDALGSMETFHRFLAMWPGVAEGERWPGNNGGGVGRDRRTYQAALAAHNAGLSPDTAIEELVAWDAGDRSVQGNNPPLGRGEIEVKVRSAYSGAENDPGSTNRSAEDAFAEVPAQAAEPTNEEPEPAGDAPGRAPRIGGDVEEPCFLILGVVMEAALTLVYGASGSFKSTTAFSWACCIATGTSWHGHQVGEPTKALIVTGEGESGIDKRLRAWLMEHGDDPELGRLIEENIRIEPMINFTDPGAVSRLLKKYEGFGAEFMLIDTVQYALDGEDEDKAWVMSLLVTQLRRFHREWNCATVAVHHSGKDESRGSRGSGALPNSCDVVFKHSASGMQVTIENEKFKEFGKWSEPLVLTAEVKQLRPGYTDRRGMERPPATAVAYKNETTPKRTKKGDEIKNGAVIYDMRKRDIERNEKIGKHALEYLIEEGGRDRLMEQQTLSVWRFAKILSGRCDEDAEYIRRYLRFTAWKEGQPLEGLGADVTKTGRNKFGVKAYRLPDPEEIQEWLKKPDDAAFLNGDAAGQSASQSQP